jgi:hypothetical protein
MQDKNSMNSEVNKSEVKPRDTNNSSTSYIKRGGVTSGSLTAEEISMHNKHNTDGEVQQPPTPNQSLPNLLIQSYSDINAEEAKPSTLKAHPKRSQKEKEKQRKNSIQSRDNLIEKIDRDQLMNEHTAPFLGTKALNAEPPDSTHVSTEHAFESSSSESSDSDSSSDDSEDTKEPLKITNTTITEAESIEKADIDNHTPKDINVDISASTGNLCGSTNTTIVAMEKLFESDQSRFEGRYTSVDNNIKINEEKRDDSSSEESEESSSSSDEEEEEHSKKQADLKAKIALRRKEKIEEDIHWQQMAEERAKEKQQMADKEETKRLLHVQQKETSDRKKKMKKEKRDKKNKEKILRKAERKVIRDLQARENAHLEAILRNVTTESSIFNITPPHQEQTKPERASPSLTNHVATYQSAPQPSSLLYHPQSIEDLLQHITLGSDKTDIQVAILTAQLVRSINRMVIPSDFVKEEVGQILASSEMQINLTNLDENSKQWVLPDLKVHEARETIGKHLANAKVINSINPTVNTNLPLKFTEAEEALNKCVLEMTNTEALRPTTRHFLGAAPI